MRILIAAAVAAVTLPTVPAMANAPAGEYRINASEAQRDYRQDRRERRNRHWRGDWRQYRNYDYNRLPRGETVYYADDYYRDGRYYRERRLSANDRIYRGRDNRYYCRRSDGTTGLIVGAVAGGLFGNAISNGRSSTIGTLLGAAVGASIGSSVDRGQVRCR